MKTRFILCAAAVCLFAIVSCQKEDPIKPEDEVPPQETVVFSASTAGAMTKTVLSDNGDDTYTLLWASGDAINVNGYSLSIQTEGQADGYGPGYTQANFSGPFAPPANGSSPKYKALYPASIFGTPGSLPVEQHYVADNVSGFPMYAESDTQSLEFHNLCGIIRIGLKGDTRSISSITLVDTDDTPKPMSGPYTVISNTAVISSGSAGTSLVCSPAVPLATDTFTYFNITLPAASYGKLKIMIEASDGYIWTLTSKHAIEVERSKITPINLSSPNFKNSKIQISYTTYNGAKINKFSGGDDASVFGTGLTVVSHTYEGGIGTITLSGEVTKIGDSAFNGLSGIVTMTIPTTVTSIGGSAFRSLNRLTTLNIPAGVTSIGDMAFQGCSAFNPAGQLDHITSFGGACFQNTLLDGDLIIGSAVTKVDNYAFRETRISSVTFEGTPSTLGNYIFLSCASLEEVTFEDDIHITPDMFYGCSALETVTFNGDCTSIGNNAFRYCSSLGSITLPNSLTSLGTYAFAGCTSLTSVTLSTNPSFTTIPTNCFDGCSLLTSLTIPSNITTIQGAAFNNCGFTSLPTGWDRSGISYGSSVFKGCPISSITFPDTWSSIPSNFCNGITTLEEIILGSGITAIGTYAFSSCSSLEDVTLNNSLSTIGNYAFSGCSSLTALSLPASMTSVGSYAFQNCGFTSMPTGWDNTAISYAGWCFKGCPITSIAFPDSWTSVPAQFCREMTALTTVVLGSGITTLNNGAFQHCTSLSAITVPEGVEHLDQYVFYECTSLSSITLPSTVNYIGPRAFQSSGLTALPAGLHGGITFRDYVFASTKMTDITIPAGILTIGESMFSGCNLITRADLNDVTTVEACAFLNCTALSTLIADKVTTLKNASFEACTSLATANFAVATTIGNRSLYNCTGLVSASLPAAVTIGDTVFYGCTKLETVDIGSNITSIGNNCFRDNTKLTSLTVRAASVPTLNTTLSNHGSFTPTIYVPSSSVEDYKGAAVWSNYAERITAIVE